MKKAVVLLSGGLDSATLAALAKSQGFEVYALTLDDGRPHRPESAAKVAASIGVSQHRILDLQAEAHDRSNLLLSHALAWCEALACCDLFIGSSAQDDEAFQNLAKLGVAGGPICIHAPLSQLDKSAIVKWGLTLGVDYSLTISCQNPTPSGESCGYCEACFLRLCGFAQNGVRDPIHYACIDGL